MHSQLYETLIMLTGFIPESKKSMETEEAGPSMGTVLRLKELDTVDHTKEHAILGYLIGCFNRGRSRAGSTNVAEQEVGDIATQTVASVAVAFLRGLMPKTRGSLARMALLKRIYYDTVTDNFLLALIEAAHLQGDEALGEVVYMPKNFEFSVIYRSSTQF